jgi:hypothetical protein
LSVEKLEEIDAILLNVVSPTNNETEHNHNNNNNETALPLSASAVRRHKRTKSAILRELGAHADNDNQENQMYEFRVCVSVCRMLLVD